VKKSLCLLLFAGLLASTLAIGKEPANIVHAKQKLTHYHDSGEYMNDIANVMQKAMRYLELRVTSNDFHSKKPAIVLDIDETSLSNYRDMQHLDFGGTVEQIRNDEDKGTDEAITPTLKLYRYAKDHHIAVFFITGRLEEERTVTALNLQKAGYTNFDGLILRDALNRKTPAYVYKTSLRKQLTEKGYTIVLNIGDQMSDLRGGYADKGFKLPNPYYFIP
jgi:predicted secreted acid phosphatase